MEGVRVDTPAAVARRLVSKEKRRYEEDGFDLDLSYITSKIIAMGFPSEGEEGFYRNPMPEVQRFLNTKHKDHYWIWNLCSERTYNHALFNNRVNENFTFDDHNPPPFELLYPLCKSIGDWLNSHSQNVAVIHCKAGKGRTGVVVSTYLLYSGLWQEPLQAMMLFAAARTYNNKGVTIPSQKRYIHYFSASLAHEGKPPFASQKLTLKSVRVSPPPVSNKIALYYKIKDKKRKEIFNYKKHYKVNKCKEDDKEILLNGVKDPLPQGDLLFEFKEKIGFAGQKRIFHFWIHTGFIENNYLCLTKEEIDGPHKDKNEKKYAPEFIVELFFEGCTQVTTSETQQQQQQQQEHQQQKRWSMSSSSSSPSSPSSPNSSSPNSNSNKNYNNNNNNRQAADGSLEAQQRLMKNLEFLQITD